MENSPPNNTFSQDKLATVEVKNQVLWVNDKLKLPFQLLVGESSPLGIMLSLDQLQNSQESSFMLGVKEGHYRAGDIGKIIFEDSEGRKYRDIDIKGSGLLSGGGIFGVDDSPKLIPLQWGTSTIEDDLELPYVVGGLMDREDAEHDARWSEKFIEWGIRTHRCAAIIELQELSEGGKLFPVSEFKKRAPDPERFESVLPKDFVPVIEVRAYGTKARISDTLGVYPSEKSKKMILENARAEIVDAIDLVAEERSQSKKMNIQEYMEWLARSVGESVGIMHSHGAIHKNLHPQNITLDARIVDLDDVMTGEDMDKKEDFNELVHNDITRGSNGRVPRGALDSIRMFTQRIKEIFPEESKNLKEEDIEKIFMEAYREKYPE